MLCVEKVGEAFILIKSMHDSLFPFILAISIMIVYKRVCFFPGWFSEY